MICEVGLHQTGESRRIYVGDGARVSMCKQHFDAYQHSDENELRSILESSWQDFIISEPPMTAQQAGFWVAALLELANEQSDPDVMTILAKEAMSLLVCDYLTDPLGESIQ